MEKSDSFIKKHRRICEILRFGVTGGVCFLAEFAVLVLLRELMHMDVLIATPIAFALSVALNYVMCVMWVFPKSGAHGKERVLFVVTSIIGLLLNELFMWLFGLMWGQEKVLFTFLGKNISIYMLNKIIATFLVTIWNYFSKRKVLVHGGKAE